MWIEKQILKVLQHEMYTLFFRQQDYHGDMCCKTFEMCIEEMLHTTSLFILLFYQWYKLMIIFIITIIITIIITTIIIIITILLLLLCNRSDKQGSQEGHWWPFNKVMQRNDRHTND